MAWLARAYRRDIRERKICLLCGDCHTTLIVRTGYSWMTEPNNGSSSTSETRHRLMRGRNTAAASPHLPLIPLPLAGNPSVGAAATVDGPGVPHGRMYNNHTPSLPWLWTRAATNTIRKTQIWSWFQRGIIRCRRYSEKTDCLSSALGQVDAVRQGTVPRHAWCELDGSGMTGASHDASSTSESRDGVAIQTDSERVDSSSAPLAAV
jgi:hypothetical protein